MHTIESTPAALMASANSMKPGRCIDEQVGVNAPGTANITTILPLKISSVVISAMPPAARCFSATDGILSPT